MYTIINNECYINGSNYSAETQKIKNGILVIDKYLNNVYEFEDKETCEMSYTPVNSKGELQKLPPCKISNRWFFNVTKKDKLDCKKRNSSQRRDAQKEVTFFDGMLVLTSVTLVVSLILFFKFRKRLQFSVYANILTLCTIIASMTVFGILIKLNNEYSSCSCKNNPYKDKNELQIVFAITQCLALILLLVTCYFALKFFCK